MGQFVGRFRLAAAEISFFLETHVMDPSLVVSLGAPAPTHPQEEPYTSHAAGPLLPSMVFASAAPQPLQPSSVPSSAPAPSSSHTIDNAPAQYQHQRFVYSGSASGGGSTTSTRGEYVPGSFRHNGRVLLLLLCVLPFAATCLGNAKFYAISATHSYSCVS